MTKNIDYFFGIGSPWAFIGLEAFTALAAKHGASIRPFVIPLVEDNGAIYSRNRPEARRAYWIKDLKRWAAVRGKTLDFDNRSTLSDPTPAGLMVIAAIERSDNWLKLTAALQAAFWERGEDIGQSTVRVAHCRCCRARWHCIGATGPGRRRQGHLGIKPRDGKSGRRLWLSDLPLRW